ncbi:MAG: hypothetical protein ACRDZ8_07065 [Acidimicrobiales bacterium]
MRTLDEFRTWKLAHLRLVLDRPGMLAPGAVNIDCYLNGVLQDLTWIDDRVEDFAASREEYLRRFGPLGLHAVAEWFRDLRFSPTEEVASLWAEIASGMGYLDVGEPLDEEEWTLVCDSERWGERDWTRSEIDALLPEPTVVVGRHVLCYAPSSEVGWAFLDFDWQPGVKDMSLRDVRLPSEWPPGGVVFTPHGQRYRPHYWPLPTPNHFMRRSFS